MAEGGLSENELVEDREDLEVQCSVCPLHPYTHLIENYHDRNMVCPDCGLIVGDT